MYPSVSVECGDFLEFQGEPLQIWQDALKTMRSIDDKIIYTLNTTIPTDSFKAQVDPSSTCKDLYGQLQEGHVQREQAIKRCITVAADKIRDLKNERQVNKDDFKLLKTLRAEQTKLRLLQVELGVEEVVQQRSAKVFHERCRGFFHPSAK